MQRFEPFNMPTYSITPIPCNELHLCFRRVVEPIVIEDFPSPMTEERIPEWMEIPIGTTIPILEDAETHAETPAKTPMMTHIRNCKPASVVKRWVS